MSALGSLAKALLDASRVADLNMHVGSYLLSGSDVRFGSIAEATIGPHSAKSRRSTEQGHLRLVRNIVATAQCVITELESRKDGLSNCAETHVGV